MDPLRIYLFGPLRMVRGTNQILHLPTFKAQRLLGYLLLHRHQLHARALLANLFWGDRPEEQARKCLRTTLWRLRTFLEPDGRSKGTYLAAENDEVSINAHDRFWLDVEEFEDILARLPVAGELDAHALHVDRQMVTSLTRAIELYAGDLLEGWYDDWLLFERERLQGMFLNALALLMACHQHQGAYQEALRCGQRILSYDPLRESIHRDVMRLHCLAGNRGLAMQQYHLCRAALARELDVEPMEETTALYAQLCRSSEPAGAGPGTGVSAHPARTDRRAARGAESPDAHPALVSHIDHAISELRYIWTEFEQLSPRFQEAEEALASLRQVLVQPDQSASD